MDRRGRPGAGGPACRLARSRARQAAPATRATLTHATSTIATRWSARARVMAVVW